MKPCSPALVKNVIVYKRTGTPRTCSPAATVVARSDGNASDDCPPNRSTPSTRSIFSIPPAPPANPRASCIPPAAIRGHLYYRQWVFDLKDEDVYWCTADIGWVTGHSYIVYGPLQNGATSLMYEGAPTSPNPTASGASSTATRSTSSITAPTASALHAVRHRMAGEASHEEPPPVG